MYSVVLMMALTSGGEVSDFGRKGGCNGGCNGCRGGLFSGLFHGRRGHGCHGCNGGSCNGGSCHGMPTPTYIPAPAPAPTYAAPAPTPTRQVGAVAGGGDLGQPTVNGGGSLAMVDIQPQPTVVDVPPPAPSETPAPAPMVSGPPAAVPATPWPSAPAVVYPSGGCTGGGHGIHHHHHGWHHHHHGMHHHGGCHGIIYPSGGCCGGVVIIGPSKSEDKKDDGKDKDQDKDKGQKNDKDGKKGKEGDEISAAPAKVVVSLPADATLTIEGQATRATGSERTFVTPALVKGEKYSWTLEAQVMQDGKPVSLTRKVTLVPGQTHRVSLTVATDLAKR